MHNARQEKFLMVFSEESKSKMPNKEIRHASFHSLKDSDDDPHLRNNLTYLERASPNVRSLLLFGSKCIQIPNFYKFRLLKVVELEGVTSNDVNMVRGLDELVHLKYLELRKCDIPISECSFHHMKALETLDIRGMPNNIYEVPNGLWSIDTLRHVLSGNSVDIPKTTAELKNIQTLKWVLLNEKMPILSNLCKLGIDTSWRDPIAFTNLFATLPSLVSLLIRGWGGLPMEAVYPTALPNYQQLQSLYLVGKWLENVTLDASLFPPRLLKLTLWYSRIGQNPMPELGKLKSLKKLILGDDAIRRELCRSGPIFCPAGFPVLQYLKLGDNSMKGLTVAEGGMPKLTYLTVPKRNFKLHLPPDLQHVSITFD